MPLLPAISGIVAIGAVVSAVSTQQISLNFAGGPPPEQPPQPQVSDSAQPDGRHGRRTARDDSSLTPRDAGRASRGAGRKAVTVTFRTVSSWNAGFQAQVTITNHQAEPVKGWTLVLSYPRTSIVSASGVNVIRKGETLVADNPVAHPSIPPGRSVKLALTANGTGIGTQPSTCSFNGDPC